MSFKKLKKKYSLNEIFYLFFKTIKTTLYCDSLSPGQQGCALLQRTLDEALHILHVFHGNARTNVRFLVEWVLKWNFL